MGDKNLFLLYTDIFAPQTKQNKQGNKMSFTPQGDIEVGNVLLAEQTE